MYGACSQVEARADVDVPDRLISEAKLQELMQKHQPRFVPVEGSSPSVSEPPTHTPDASRADNPSQGVMQLRLSNGIRVNARRTLNEPKAAMLRMVAAGQCLSMLVTTCTCFRKRCIKSFAQA